MMNGAAKPVPRFRRCRSQTTPTRQPALGIGFQVQVVSISSLKGGVGKTSVTTGLASAALAAGIPTLVVDLDPHADASTALGVQPSDKLDIGRMLKNPRKARLPENVVASGWTARAQSNGSGPTALDVAVGSAYTAGSPPFWRGRRSTSSSWRTARRP